MKIQNKTYFNLLFIFFLFLLSSVICPLNPGPQRNRIPLRQRMARNRRDISDNSANLNKTEEQIKPESNETVASSENKQPIINETIKTDSEKKDPSSINTPPKNDSSKIDNKKLEQKENNNIQNEPTQKANENITEPTKQTKPEIQPEQKKPEEIVNKKPEEIVNKKPEEIVNKKPEEIVNKKPDDNVNKKPYEIINQKLEEIANKQVPLEPINTNFEEKKQEEMIYKDSPPENSKIKILFEKYAMSFHRTVSNYIPYPYDYILMFILGYYFMKLITKKDSKIVIPKKKKVSDINIATIEKKNKEIFALQQQLSKKSAAPTKTEKKIVKTKKSEITDEIDNNKIKQIINKLEFLMKDLTERNKSNSTERVLQNKICELQMNILKQSGYDDEDSEEEEEEEEEKK